MAKKSGFTLIELCVVMAIIAVATAVAVPNWIARRAQREWTTTLSQSVAMMNRARVVAVKENTRTTVVFDAGENVFRAFVDTAGDQTYDPLKDRLIGVYDIPPGVFISKSTFPVANQEAGRHYCMYNPHGLPVRAGAVELAVKTGRTGKVTLAMSGRIRVE